MKVANPGLPFYANRIKQGRPFSFVRFGDGEWTAGISHDRSRTTSGSQALNIKGLQEDMRRGFVNCPVAENYMPALRPTSLNPAIEKWVAGNVPKGVKWHDCRVFYLSSAHGVLFPLIEALRTLKIPLVLVGPVRLWSLRLTGIFPNASFVIIPGKDCYTMKNALLEQIRALPHPAFVGFTAGPTAKVMIYELYQALGDTSFFIDFGSLWDVYVGHKTRNYHKTMTFETVRRNILGS